MSTWGEILEQLKKQAQEGNLSFDAIRRAALKDLHDYTGRNAILYAAGHLQKPELGQAVSITDEDLEGFMEVIYETDGRQLDLILHSPGGVPEAADSIVQYLRSKFGDIRVIVPHMAMSAATMVAMSADVILMARHSKLGPIDPQLVLRTDSGVTLAPAVAVLDQFERAKSECTDQQTLAVWYPILKQYGPAVLEQCSNAIAYSEERVRDWLVAYMFKRRENKDALAEAAASELADHRKWKTHGRPLTRDGLRKDLGLRIKDLEADQELQERVLTVYHAFMHTFAGTAAYKIIENHLGRSFIKLSRPVSIGGPEAKEEGGSQEPE